MTKLISTSMFLMFILAVSLGYGADGFEYAPDANTVGLWHLDEGDGDTIIDASANGFDGVVEGAAAWGDEGWKRDGSSATSFAFDGSTLVNMGNVKELINPDAITVEAWVYANNLGGWHLICCNWGGAEVGAYHLGCLDGAPKLHVTTSDGTSSVEPAQTLEVEKWYHIAGTYDEGTGEIQLYVNGELAGSTAHGGELIDNDMDVTIGSKHSREFYWDGQIDEVRISDVVRTPDELSINLEESSAVSIANSAVLTWGSIKNGL